MDSGIRVSASIMTHPSRIEQASRMAAEHPALNFSIACDPEPDQPRGSLRTALVAWSQVAPRSTHHLVVQDDVLLHPDFERVLPAAVSAMADRAIAFFSEWGSQTSYAIRIGALAGAGWVEVVDWYTPSLALVLPAGAARQFGGYAATHRYRSRIEDDDLLSEFLRELGIQAVVSIPNWVEHADGPSIAGNDSHGLRKATAFLPECGGTWNPEVLHTPRFIPSFSWHGGFPYAIRKPDDRGELWSRAPIEDLLAEYGLDRSRIDGILCAAQPVWPEAASDPDTHADKAKSIALCAIALGASASCFDVDIHRTLDLPITQAALATMIPGAFRRYFPASTLAAVTPSMRAMLGACITGGYLSSRLRPCRGRPG
jgi:hypothetical protein